MTAYREVPASKTWPFIGLRPFQFKDHDYFFGREKELDELEPKVTQNGFVAIVGGSGSGKSSLISAGLRPQLAAPRWRWIDMRPADAPIRKLALALANLTNETGDLLLAWADRLERVLTKSSFGIAEALRTVPEESGRSRVLLLVDQFEELFRFASLRSEDNVDPVAFAENRDEATLFVRLLLAATESCEVPIHVVITMRSDFIGDCARFYGLSQAVSKSQFLVPGMTRDQREDVIRKPLELAGAEIDPGVVQRALIATNEEPDQLPILQHAMMRCWGEARRRIQDVTRPTRLTIEDYNAIGGVEHALSNHANELLEELHQRPDGTAIGFELATKRVFQALTEIDPEGRSVRRPQRFHDLFRHVRPNDVSDDAAKEATTVVVDRFASHDCSFLRIIPPAEAAAHSGEIDSNIRITDNCIVDIGHEALIRRWDKLKPNGKEIQWDDPEEGGKENWTQEEERDAEEYRALLRFATRGTFIPAEDLTKLEKWWNERKPNSFWAERYTGRNKVDFEKIQNCLAQSRAKVAEEVEAQQRNEARMAAVVARAIRVPREYSGAADSLAMALANRRPEVPAVPEYLSVLYEGLAELREQRRIQLKDEAGQQIFAISFAPVAKLMAAAISGKLLFYDTDTWKLVHSIAIPGGWLLSLRWSPNGKRIYVGISPSAKIITVCTIKELRKYFKESIDDLDAPSIDIGDRERPAGFGSWSQDGKWILGAQWQGRAGVWDATTGQFDGFIGDDPLGDNPLDKMICDLAVSPDSGRVALGAVSGKIHIFNVDSSRHDRLSLKFEKSLNAIDSNHPTAYSLVFQPRDPNRIIATYVPNPQMALWAIDDSTHKLYVARESGMVWRIAFDPKGEVVASASNDGVVRLWTPRDRPDAIQLHGHLAPATCVALSPDGGIVASGSFDGTIRLWGRESPLSVASLSSETTIPPGNFSMGGLQLSVTTANERKYSVTLPEGFDPSAAAVSSIGGGVAVVPRSFGRPLLFVNVPGYANPARVTLSGVEADWTAVAFIENDTRVAAKTKEGKLFAWPFETDVLSLERLAREHMPLVQDENGSEKRLTGRQLAEGQIPAFTYSSRPYTRDDYIVPLLREDEVANARSSKSTPESRQRSIRWLADHSQIIELNDTALSNFNLDRIRTVKQSSFTRATLANGSFVEAELKDANFTHAVITGVNFANSNLRGARFDEAIVSMTSFEGVDLKFGRFDGARLRSQVNFSQADLDGTSFRNVKYDSCPNFERAAWWLATGWGLDQVADFVKAFGKAAPEKRRKAGAYPMFERELDRFEMMLEKPAITPMQRIVALDGKAWTLAIHGCDLEEAERVSREAFKTINTAELSNEDTARPMAYISDTLAYILMQRQRADEALELKKENYGVQEPGGIFRYALALHISGRTEDALDMLRESEQVKSYSPSHELYLLYDYFMGAGKKFLNTFRGLAK
jgi:WD40 repeat protein